METTDEIKKELETKSLVSRAENDGVKFIEVCFTDAFGTLKGVEIPAGRLERLLDKGIFFDGCSIKAFTPIQNSDLILKGLASTYSVLPWTLGDKKTARVICDVYKTDGSKLEASPRRVLERVVEEAKSLGFDYLVGPEPEFFVFEKSKKLELSDKVGYFDIPPSTRLSDFRKDVMIAFEKFGLKAEMGHKEVAPSQHEINFEYADALKTADSVVNMKSIVKTIADAYDLHATFLPKPLQGENGSGMHCHFSLFKNGEPSFYDADGKYCLSDEARWFIGGILAHVRESALLLAPTVNSYKRLVPGFEAPVYLSWGRKNRTALIRVPAVNEEEKKATRAELRCPDPSGSPHLVFAAIGKMGLKGIREKIEPGAPVTADLFETLSDREAMPGSLGEAITLFEGSELMRSLMGEAFEPYLKAKKEEWDSYRIAVTDWEIERYYDTI